MLQKLAAIYVRVSTTEQNTEIQEAELKQYVTGRGWTAVVYRDHGISGAQQTRPALDTLMEDVRRKKVPVVVVWALDRLARSLKHLLEIADEFNALGVDLISYKQNLDTSSAAGRLTYQVLGAVAEFERAMLTTRIRAGLDRARRNGKRVGRPPLRRFDSDDKTAIQAARRSGASIRRLAIEWHTTEYVIKKMVEGSGESH